VSPYLVERLAELRRHLDHLAQLRPRVSGRAVLERDLSLHNDVLFSLLTVCQLVIDVAGDFSAQRGDRFEDYSEAVRNLAATPAFHLSWSASWSGSRAFATCWSTNTWRWISIE